jgi:hypothetical protein
MEVPGDNRGIARLEQPRTGTYGWHVRIQRRGVKHAKYFSDRAHGGAGHSLLAARAWRDVLLERFASEERARVCGSSVRNSSGVVGVSRVTVTTSRGGVYQFWQAAWSPSPGERRSIRFSIKRHGDEVAFQLAVRARLEGAG